MQTLIYDGSFEGWLCAVFDVYEYRFKEVELCTEEKFKGNIFEKVHNVNPDPQHAIRVWKGLEQKLSATALLQVKRAFLSEHSENVLLRYAQYVFNNKQNVENDYSHPDVLEVVQTARKVWREKHRMEAFVRFQKLADDLYYAIVEPDYNVLPLIAPHFTTRYADQKWMIYDVRRKYGLYYNLQETSYVQVSFSEEAGGGKAVNEVLNESDTFYQELWKRYFNSVNISSRKNTKLHLQHMPRRYWKYLTEKHL